METTHTPSWAGLLGYVLLICLCCFTTQALAQTPTITVRFNNPTYDCMNRQYCLDVEFLSDTPGVELFGMNVRLFYPDTLLELDSFTMFQGGYGPVSPDPPTVLMGPGGFLGFTGPADFVNGAIQLTDPNQTPILLNNVTWTKLFQICFHVDAPDTSSFCPPIVFDLEMNPADGGFLVGDDGVVITIVDPSMMMESLPVNENVVQFNWMYNPVPPPFGTPISTTCISLDCAPVITCAANITIQCDASTSPSTTGSPTSTDICAGDPTFTFTDSTILGNCPNNFIIRRTYIVMNACNLADTCVQFITVQDTSAPSIQCPSNTTVQCANQFPSPNPGSVSTTDNCAGLVTVTFVGDMTTNQVCANRFTVTRTYRATDVCGNSATCTQTITVFDDTAPFIQCPDNITVQCANQVPAPNIALVTTSDNCNGATTVSFVNDAISGQSCVNRFTIARTYQAIDACGNSASCTQTITVFDNTVPFIQCPENTTVQCANQVPTANIGLVTVSDNCNGTATVSFLGDVISGQTCINRYTIDRTYLAIDECGNSASCTQTITVFDNTPPIIACPANTTVQCASLVPGPNTTTVTASDNCGGGATVTFLNDFISNQTCANRFTVTRTYRATDACGNSATCTQILTVFDNTPPTIICPDDVTVECAGLVPVANVDSVVASDNCNGGVVIEFVSDVVINQTCANRLTLLRTYRATDFCGNSATCTQSITVNDQTPPSISCPANITLWCASQVPVPNTMNVIATDNCGGSTSVVFVNDVISNQACLNRFIVTRTYRATDACGNSATCSRTITVSDFTPPSITCPQNVTVQCANLVPPANIGLVTASDNCNGAATVSFLGDVISGQTCVNRYTIARTYRAIDECGNSASCTQTITVFDNTPPSIVCPANTTVQCASLVPGPDTTTVTASDNCGGGATVTFLNDFISNQTCANRFTVTRTYRATDACGNSATCTQILTVFDNTPPTITCPNDVTVECAALVPVADVASVVASDNCGGAVTVTLDGEVGSNQTCINGYTITRTYRATDACGNSATCTQTIVVRDQTPPEVMCPASVTVQCASEIPVADPSTVSVSDNCGENATVRFVNDVISNQSCVNRFTVTRTYQAIDNCGNSASCIQIITVNDTTPPVITCPANLTIQNGSSTTPTMSGPNSSVVNLGTASTFALFTASGAFNNVGASFVVGDIGTNVGAFSGFPPGLVIGQIHVADAVSATAATDVAAAYGFLSGVSCDSTIGTTLGNNQILPPHIYCLGAASNLNGNLILDGKGDPNAVFIFKIDGALSTTSFSNISLIDSASACNVFWQINGAVALGDHSVFRGTILTSGAISLATAAVLDGSGLSTSGAVSTSTDIVALCASGNAVPAIATATDNCDQSPLVTFNDVTIAGNCQDEYEIQRTWTATDACNNSATCLQTIEVAGSCGVDLALTKDLDPGQAVVAGGDNVNFTITVTNQGVVTISSLTITDYIPLGFSLNDPDWLPGTAGSTGQSASIVLSIMNGGLGAGGLLPGGSVSVGITLQADANIHSGIYNNLAEISQEIDINGLDVSNSDIDSNADNNDTNDAPGEDDIDAAPICVVNPIITGPVFVCGGDTTIYGLEFFNTTSLYTFLLANGGTIISTTDSTATVVWQLTPGGPFTIKVTEVASPGCVGMDSLKVIIRGSDPIACIDHLNLSIDNACGTVVHSGMILVGEAPGDTNYTVIIRDQNGNIIPNATFTYEHVGQTFNVMVVSECSGQSCWGKVTVEDKFPPVINCVCPEDNANSMCTITCREIEQFIAGNIPPELRPTVVDNCGGVTLEIINTNLDFSYCANGSIQVTWKATDASGNMSTCRQVFGIVPLTLETLTFPKDYIGVCNGSSDPSVTGFPQVGGIDLDLPGGLCNISVMYQDEVIQLCGNGIKILRRWTVRDWCTGQTRVFGQTILLSDHEGPVLVCVANMQVSTDLYNCYANVLVPKPAATDSCSKVTGFQLFSNDGTVVKVGNNFIINGLPQGVHSVKWVVTDECGNTSSCNVNITVVDDVPPIVSCQSRTIIGLTNERSNGITLVPASVFSDGSFDNCGPVSFRARRMDSCIDFDWTTGGACVDEIPGGFPAVNGKDRGTDRSTCVPFACCDVNNGLIMVELEVSDASGNVNYCMVEVQVQDKLAPTIICPPDITLSCDFLQDIHLGTFTDISGNNDGSLDEDPLSGLFGNVYDAFNHIPSDRKNIIINDPNNTYYPQPHTFGIEGWANDNCQVDLQVTVTEINDCSGASLPFNPPHNARRLIERRFRAFDGVTAGTCLQLIWIVDFSPFFITDSTCLNENPNDGVIWPCDVLLNTCPQDLSGTGEPVLFDDGCSIIGVSHEDHRFNFSDSACYKVLREWKVIDWCQFNPATGAGFWTYTQVIKVFDGIAPVFVNCPQAPVQLCTDDPGISIPANNQIFLGENNPDATSCSVHVIMTQRVHEDCSEMIFYDVKYYPFNGTSFIQIVPTTSTTLNADHEVDISFNTQLSSIPSIQQNGLPYNSPLCGDYHRVVWTVEDGCGNQTICDYLFRLEDCKDPTPVLIDGLSTAIMGPLGTVTISASNFNASSNDDCTPGDELLFSFSGTSYEPTFTYTCDNVPVFGQPFDVTIWVADGGSDLNCNGQIEWSERNTAFSTTTLVITDPNNVCGQLQSSLTGEILTDHQDAVEKVIVNLSSPQQLFPAYTTSGDGKFVFSGIPAGLDYTITPQRNDDYKNGVSTLDLVGIQKHLLGKEIFTSPYQYIAADANNSRSVSALDLIELRKLILGIIPVLPNNDSWRFLDKNTVIPDPSDPWLFNENLYIQHWSGQSAQNDFIAVKVGDINNSVKANAQQLLPRGDRRVMDIMAETKEEAKEGEIIELKLTLPEIVSGFQWTLETDGFEYVGVNSGDVQIDDSNIGLLGNGITTMSWNGDVLSDGSPKNEVHIIMRWKAIASGKIKNRIRLTSLMTPAESYTPSGEILEVKLTYANLEVASDFNLYQNKPNPWNGQTTIGFDLPEDGSARLTIFDVTGQMVANFEKYFKAGYNTIVLSEKEMHATGVLYYRLESGGNSASKKMVLIR